MTHESKIRVFISYSHEDQKLVKRIVRQLKEIGIVPIFDKNFAFGTGFHEQIKLYIAHAHVFMPVITASSIKRGWVHQEIGFAAALNVPVLPVAFGALPGEMIQQLHAATIDVSLKTQKETKKSKTNPIKLKRRALSRLQSILTRKDLVKLIRNSQGLSQATFEFTRHAPSMNARIEAFDELFLDLLGDVKPRDSRYVAIETLNSRIEELIRTVKESL